MNRLKGKVAVVTGASKGIGAAIAKEFARQGASVVVNYNSGAKDAERVVAEITKAGGNAIAVRGDVAIAKDVKDLFAATKRAFDTLDIVVNNAAVYAFAPLENLSEEDFHRQFNINVLGTLLVAREAVPHFGPRGGSIINIGSVASTNPPPGSVVYSATKGAIDTITIELSRELAPRKIRVNNLAPGGTETEGTHAIGIIGSDFAKTIIERTPLGRLGQPDDIATAAVFLASDDAGWVTGERLGVSGGDR